MEYSTVHASCRFFGGQATGVRDGDMIGRLVEVGRRYLTRHVAVVGLTASHEESFQPIVKELLGERLTNHMCDRRSPVSWIKEHHPDYIVGSRFSENDMLWSSSREGTAEEHIARK